MCETCVEDGSVSREVFDLIEAFSEIDPESEFGGGHIVIADCNVEDSHIRHCLDQTYKPLRPIERAFLELLLLVPENERCPKIGLKG